MGARKDGVAAFSPVVDGLTIALGAAVTFAVQGYRFGEGNQTIYLLSPLRRVHADLLTNDWFTTQTLQYHAAFGLLAEKLMQWNILQPAFFALYILLILLVHAAWLGIVRQFTQSRTAYLASVLLYYLSAAGTGLGFYQLFQDSSVLASNIANVAMFWGIYLWIAGRSSGSGACFGVAGLFHLNHAVVVVGLWLVLGLSSVTSSRWKRGEMLAGSFLALLPSLANIAIALGTKMNRSGLIPLDEFVDLYVRFRHPHHYDPSSWPWWIWVAFAWPIPLALAAAWTRWSAAAQRARTIFLVLLALQIVALIGAGIWYFNETLIQLSLYRFSTFIQILACIGSGIFLIDHIRARHITAWGSAIGCAAVVAICLVRGPFFGAFRMRGNDADYRALCQWVRANTPIDAVFVVPPDESGFRLHAQRAIVVNFKAVPQLSSELLQWRGRMCDVLDLPDFRSIPRGYVPSLKAIAQRYAVLSAEQFLAVARKYDARFVVATRPLEQRDDLCPIFSTPARRYFLYTRTPAGGRP